MNIFETIRNLIRTSPVGNLALYIAKEGFIFWNEITQQREIILGEPSTICKTIDSKILANVRRIILSPEFYELHLLDEVPPVPLAEYDEALRWQMAELLKKDGTDLIVRHFPFFKREHPNIGQRYYVAVASHTELKTLIDNFAHPSLETITINELALSEWQSQQDADGKSAILMAVASHQITVYFFNEDHFCFKRVIPGSEPLKFVDAIQRTLSYCRTSFNAPEISRVFSTDKTIGEALAAYVDSAAKIYHVKLGTETGNLLPESMIALASTHPLSVEVCTL